MIVITEYLNLFFQLLFLGFVTILAYLKNETIVYIIAAVAGVLFGFQWIQDADLFIVGVMSMALGAGTFLMPLIRYFQRRR